MACPASVKFSASYPDFKSKSADLGICAHFLLEYCLKNALKPWEFVSQVITTPTGIEFEVDMDMADAVTVALEYVYSRVAQANEQGLNPVMYSEMKVEPTSINRDDIKGPADIIIDTTAWIEAIDYKHGEGILVEIDDNPQLQLYGIGAIDTLGKPLGDRELVTTIIQPRIPSDKGVVRSARYSERDVSSLALDFMHAGQLVDAGDRFCAGAVQCRRCPAKGDCSVLADYTMGNAAATGGTSLAQTPSITIESNMIADPNSLPMDQVIKILENETLIRGFLEAVHTRALDLMNAGTKVPGFKLVNGKKSKTWNMPEEDLSKMLRSIKRVGGGKVTLEDIHVTKIKSPSAIVKMLGSSVTKAAKKKIEAAYSENPGKPQLAPASSSIPEIAQPADVFEKIEAPADPLPSFLQ